MIVSLSGRGENRPPKPGLILSIGFFSGRKQCCKIPPQQFLRRISEKLSKSGIAARKVSLQIGGEHCSGVRVASLRSVRRSGALADNTRHRRSRVRVAVGCRHETGLGMMLTQPARSDREACHVGSNQGNIPSSRDYRTFHFSFVENGILGTTESSS